MTVVVAARALGNIVAARLMTESVGQPRTLRLGTRGSQLARWQAEWVAGELQRLGHAVELIEIATHGDVDRSRPIEELGTLGVFTKAIQQALLAGDVDLAVHSLKDLPTEPVAGLVLAAVPERESAADVCWGGRGEGEERGESELSGARRSFDRATRWASGVDG